MSEDCYIYWDGEEVPEAQRTIHVQCADCHKNNKKGVRWSALMGYGPTVRCCTCDHVIHQGDNEK